MAIVYVFGYAVYLDPSGSLYVAIVYVFGYAVYLDPSGSEYVATVLLMSSHHPPGQFSVKLCMWSCVYNLTRYQQNSVTDQE